MDIKILERAQEVADYPLVSIMIISYQQADYIEEAVESALCQDYCNAEVIVSDDGSTDGTDEKILAMAEKYPGKVLPIVGGPNLGITGNSNRALKACNGRYVAFQGGDDVLRPSKIRRQVEWFQSNPGFAMNYHDVDVFESRTGRTLYHWSDRFFYREGGAEVVIKHGTFMCGTSVMIDRKLCPHVWFDSKIPVTSDWLFWIEVLAAGNGKIGYLAIDLARYRRHQANVTSSKSYYLTEFLDTLDIVDTKYPAYGKYTRYRRSAGCLFQAKEALDGGRYLVAVGSLLRSMLPRNGYGIGGALLAIKKVIGARR